MSTHSSMFTYRICEWMPWKKNRVSLGIVPAGVRNPGLDCPPRCGRNMVNNHMGSQNFPSKERSTSCNLCCIVIPTLHTMYKLYKENKTIIRKKLVSVVPKIVCPQNMPLFTPSLFLILRHFLGHL